MSPTNFYLTKRNNGVYYIGTRLTPTKIQWKTTHCKLKSEALASIKNTEMRFEKKQELLQIQLSEWLNKFQIEKQGILRVRTLGDYKKCINYFLKAVGDKPLSAYVLQDIEQYKRRLLDRGLSPMSINLQLRCIKALFNYAVKSELLEKSPFAKCSILRIPQRLPLYIPQEELRTLLDSVKNTVLYDVFLFAGLTGLRVSEIVNLQWRDIDITQRKIIIQNTDTFTTKSGRVRSVPLHDELIEMLSKRQRNHIPYVFTLNGRKMTSGYLSHQFKKQVRLCKLNERYHFHTLRHTCASLLVSEGVSLYVVQNILGHSQISTTQIYSHIAPNTMIESINKVHIY